MKTVYVAESALDAQLIYDQLLTEGIEVFIAGLPLSGGMGELPGNMWPEVRVVNDEQYLKARAMVEKITDSSSEQMVVIDNCPNCGEVAEADFKQCWNCGCFYPQLDVSTDEELAILDSLSLTIREARDTDSEAILKLIFEVLSEFGLEPDPEGIDGDLSAIESNYQENGGVLWIIEDANQKIIATTALAIRTENTVVGNDLNNNVELRKMYIQASYRNQGLGALLLKKSLDWCQKNNVIKISLETASVLKSAMALYRKFGFQEIPPQSQALRCDRHFELNLSGS